MIALLATLLFAQAAPTRVLTLQEAQRALPTIDNRSSAPRAPTAARAISRRVDRGGRTEGASSDDGAGRVAVVGPSSQERGPCGLPAQRAERPAERVRGALPSSLASLPTYVQRADRALANDRSETFGIGGIRHDSLPGASCPRARSLSMSRRVAQTSATDCDQRPGVTACARQGRLLIR